MHSLAQGPDDPQPARAAAPNRSAAGDAHATSFDALLDRVERDGSAHMTAGPASVQDLARLESEIGHALPQPLRMFLARLGGGIYYERHELFGPTRAMIHDIELLPPLTQVCKGLPAGVIPVHRAGGVIHFMDLRGDAAPVPVFSLMSAERYPDFGTFLREVVVPRTGTAAGAS